MSLYQCSECQEISSVNDWNQTTHEGYRDSDSAESWEEDEYFYPLEMAIENGESAFFVCPKCHYHHSDTDNIHYVRETFKKNVQAKKLLSESW
jgi:hypothetical protein